VENGVGLIKLVNEFDWNNAHQVVVAMEDDHIREFRKIEAVNSLNISEMNAPISDESVF